MRLERASVRTSGKDCTSATNLASKDMPLEKTTLPNSCQMQDATRSNSEQVAASRK